MKYNRVEIMRRAWEIKKQNKENIFGLCLRMAWTEAKTEKTTEDKLIEAGANRWEKYGYARVYVSKEMICKAIGLVCNTENPRIGYRKPELDGDVISYAEADRWLAVASKIWFNCDTQQFEAKESSSKTERVIEELTAAYAA